MMTAMRTGTVNTHSQQRRNNRGRGGGRTNNDASNNGNRNNGRQPTTTRLYCWSHGACAHGSADCNSSLTGHKTTATFQNMQGGSTKGLQYVPTNHSS
jgi:hypothetical protein